MDKKLLDSFRKLAYELTGVTIDSTRGSMLESRVGSRMRRTGIEDPSVYYKLVLDDDAEQRLFIDKITTHETSFFRTPRVWHYIEEHFLPAWASDHPSQTCNVWSAACATGEEAYSLATVCTEFAKKKSSFRFSIDGSDISEEVVDRCRKGHYQQRAIKRFSEDRSELFSRYISSHDSHYEVSDSLKSATNFFAHNLFKSPRERKKYDLVLLRNVLIYFSIDDQKRVLANIRRAMRDDAILIIGESESISNLDCGFVDVQPLIYSTSRSVPGAVATSG